MNRKLGIQNFRVFDEKGAQFKLAPITVLTGCNSSGKSSVIKAIMLFEKYMKDFKADYLKKDMKAILSYPLELNQGEHKLAKFRSSLNKESESDEMVFSWSKHSLFLNREIEVEFTFKENTKNLLGNGLLNQIRIVCEGNSIYSINFGAEEKDTSFSIDYVLLKNLYFDFVQKIANGDSKFTIDFNPAFDKSFNYLMTNNLLYKNLSKVNAESNILRQDSAYLYLKNAAEDEKMRLVSFFKSLNNKDATSNTLFYTPAYNYLKDATKENINELIFNKIEDFDSTKVDGHIIYVKDSFIKNMGKIAASFIESGHTYFKDYFAEKEKEFLSEQYTKEINIGGALSTRRLSKNNFLDMTTHRLKLIYSEYGMDTDFEIDSLNTDIPLSSFEQLYVFMYGLSNLIETDYCLNNIVYYEDSGFDGESPYIVEKSYVALKEHFAWVEYINLFLEDAIFNLPDFLENVEFINSNRPIVERFYDLSNLSSTFGHLIKEYVSLSANEISIKDNKTYKLGNFLRKWVKEFEIADDVVFESTTEGSGIFIYLVADEEKRLLADLGYGITQVLSMLLKIELSIINTFELSKTTSIIGPIEYSNYYENKERTLTIEEPEANLHPKLQSRLADMFMEANEKYNINFILETHSEYLIRKLQYLVANPEHNAKSEDISIYYMYHPEKVPADKTQVVDLEMRPDGLLKKDFGEGFFDEASSWTFELLKLQSLN